MAPFTIKTPKLALAPADAAVKPAAPDQSEAATPSKSKPKDKSAKGVDVKDKERKEKRKAKKLEAKVNAEKEEGSGSDTEGYTDFEDAPAAAAKIEQPTAANKQRKTKADEGPVTRIDFDALGEDHMELKKEVQGLKLVIVDLQTTAIKHVAQIYRLQDEIAGAAPASSKMEVEEKKAGKADKKAGKKEKGEKGEKILTAYQHFTLAARPKLKAIAAAKGFDPTTLSAG
jgi:hypothetical protein